MDHLKTEIEALRGLRTSLLVARYTEVWGKPPRIKHAEYLRKRIAWKIHEQRCGGLSTVAKQRLEELIAEIDLGFGTARTATGVLKTPAIEQKSSGPTPGTILRRRWRDQDVEVLVREDGFEYGGKIHKSLSAVAKAITGTHWNGRLFFGLVERKST